jgi:hypothetical protein
MDLDKEILGKETSEMGKSACTQCDIRGRNLMPEDRGNPEKSGHADYHAETLLVGVGRHKFTMIMTRVLAERSGLNL